MLLLTVFNTLYRHYGQVVVHHDCKYQMLIVSLPLCWQIIKVNPFLSWTIIPGALYLDCTAGFSLLIQVIKFIGRQYSCFLFMLIQSNINLGSSFYYRFLSIYLRFLNYFTQKFFSIYYSFYSFFCNSCIIFFSLIIFSYSTYHRF